MELIHLLHFLAKSMISLVPFFETLPCYHVPMIKTWLCLGLGTKFSAF